MRYLRLYTEPDGESHLEDTHTGERSWGPPDQESF
jgi:hypothetical protein